MSERVLQRSIQVHLYKIVYVKMKRTFKSDVEFHKRNAFSNGIIVRSDLILATVLR